jgi:hypothetical protein
VRLFCFFIISSFIIIIGCTQKVELKKAAPDDLIPREQFIDILVDIKIFDAILAMKQRKKLTDMDYTKYFIHNSIMEKYSISRQRFERSLEYYQQDMEEMDAIYAEAITRLSKMKSEAEKE